MKRTDFVDQDLTPKGRPSGAPTGGDELSLAKDAREEGDVPVHSVSDFNVGRLAKHRDEVHSGVAGAMTEIELLRRRQQDLEQEKRDLEELARKQEEYEKNKRDIIDHLNEGVVALEKKEIQSGQLTELVGATRSRFKEALDEIANISEEDWADDSFREELYRALVIVDDARMEYNKALAKIQVLESRSQPMLEGVALQEGAVSSVQSMPTSFSFWLKVGIAITLPIAVVGTLITAIYIALSHYNWI